jgi:transaldolase
MNPLVQLFSFGQSFWYDNIRRKFLVDGTLAAMIADDGLRGMTSNPSIFEKAIGGSDDYDTAVNKLVRDGLDVNGIYEALALADIQMACDLFLPLYENSDGTDGYVSLEVSPYLAHDTEGTVSEARRLRQAVGRPNVMIKVPATKAGIPAIRQLIGEGIHVNVTLMFNMAHYEAVAQAYMDGLRHFVKRGGDPKGVASVASFFVSRVDTAVDKLLSASSHSSAQALLGKTAVANSKVVYQRFLELFHGDAFADLRKAGARNQRLLWASTSTKNPAYPDTLYVDELIGPETVNTMPQSTLEAFRDHGTLSQSLTRDVEAAYEQLQAVEACGVDLTAVTEKLQEDGVAAFSKSFDSLMATIETKINTVRAG